MASRVIYQSLALFASQNVAATGMQTGIGTITGLSRVTEFSDSFSRTLENLTVFGNLAPIDRIDLEAPTVNANFTYYVTNGYNERFIGLNCSTGTQPLVSCISGILAGTTNEKNYYLLVTEQGSDAAGYEGGYSGVIGIGSSFLSNYTLNVAVNSIVTANVEIEGLNWVAYSDVDGTNIVPAINPENGDLVTGSFFILPEYQTNQIAGQVAALQYGQAQLSLTGDFGFGPTSNNYNVQSATITLPLSRSPISRLGSRYPFAREPDFPIIASMQVEAEITGIGSKNLANILCEGPQNAVLRINKPFCAGSTPEGAMMYFVRGAKITSLDQSNAVGSNSTVSITYEMALASAQETGIGIFISGSNP